jgi:threonine dehydratase
MRLVRVPTVADRAAATRVVRAALAVTPVLAAPTLGPGVVMKLETVQPTGSFKVRGGLAAVAAALHADPERPLVTASAGNHGLGVAYAADRLGARATVVVAETAAEIKVEALRRFRVQLVRHGDSYGEAEAFALHLAAETGGRFISPYNDADVIAGQASLADELASQVPGLRSIVIPVGGGGLLSGIGLATEGTGIDLVGVEPDRSAAMAAALGGAETVSVETGETIADGLAGDIEPGSVTVELARRFVADMVTVTEDEIRTAIRFLAFEHGLVVEGSGAAGVAALQAGRLPLVAEPAAVILTGRNISAPLLVEILGS